MKHILLPLLVAALGGLLTSCNTSNPATAAKDQPGYHGGPPKPSQIKTAAEQSYEFDRQEVMLVNNSGPALMGADTSKLKMPGTYKYVYTDPYGKKSTCTASGLSRSYTSDGTAIGYDQVNVAMRQLYNTQIRMEYERRIEAAAKAAKKKTEWVSVLDQPPGSMKTVAKDYEIANIPGDKPYVISFGGGYTAHMMGRKVTWTNAAGENIPPLKVPAIWHQQANARGKGEQFRRVRENKS